MIRINNLSKVYGSNKIFDDFNLSVTQGEMLAIVGNSGKGKTTLLNIIGSLEPFDSGRVEVNNRDIKKINHKQQLQFLREEVSFLFQNYGLMENHSVYHNIAMGRKLDKAEKESVDKALRDVNLSGFKDRLVNTLSGGEQQRVALARIMVKPSKLILADEPTGNLDDMNSSIVWDILGKLRDMDKTVVVVTHEVKALDQFDRLIDL